MCCVCGGGSTSDSITNDDNNTNLDGEGTCVDTNFLADGTVITDDYNDGCNEYSIHPSWCEQYDT